MKPAVIPVLYAQDICLYGKGSTQCRFLEKKSGRKDNFSCLNNTAHMGRINAHVNEIQLDRAIQGKLYDPISTAPQGRNCDGIQKIHPNVLITFEGPIMPVEVTGVSIAFFEAGITECLIKANEHAQAISKSHELSGKFPSPAERLGFFCTTLRSCFIMKESELKRMQTAPIIDFMIDTRAWISPLVPAVQPSYYYHTNKIVFPEGEWFLNNPKMNELASNARMGITCISEEALVQAECTQALMNVEKSLPTLDMLTRQAKAINDQSDICISSMVSIAESLER